MDYQDKNVKYVNIFQEHAKIFDEIVKSWRNQPLRGCEHPFLIIEKHAAFEWDPSEVQGPDICVYRAKITNSGATLALQESFRESSHIKYHDESRRSNNSRHNRYDGGVQYEELLDGKFQTHYFFMDTPTPD